MAIRLEVQPDGQIEIMRPRSFGKTSFSRYETLDQAMIVIRFLLRRDIQEAKEQKFTPQAVKEARQAFKQLSNGSPYNGQKAK